MAAIDHYFIYSPPVKDGRAWRETYEDSRYKTSETGSHVKAFAFHWSTGISFHRLISRFVTALHQHSVQPHGKPVPAESHKITSAMRNSVEPVLASYRCGKINRVEAIRRVRGIVRNMVYEDQDGRNYIFMSSYDGTMLVQPFEPHMEFTDQWDLRDANGLYILRELAKAARIHPSGSFVRYHYYLPKVHAAQEKGDQASAWLQHTASSGITEA